MNTPRYAVGVDIGGTFTDCFIIDEAGNAAVGKAPTTPDDRSRGFFDSIADAALALGTDVAGVLSRTIRLVHGTTTGINAIVSRTGAKVGLLATAGHGDAIFIMKGGGRTAGMLPDQLLDLVAARKPDPIVPRAQVVEIEERIDLDGNVVVALCDESARSQIHALLRTGVDAIAISLLWSSKNPRHEQRLRALISDLAPDMFVSCSSDVVSRIGEYERTVTCVMNAYIGPLMIRYIDAIEARARSLGYSHGVQFAQCGGGAMSAAEARSAPIFTLQSGPVAGVIASVLFAQRTNIRDIITTDMGGTTFDVSVIRDGNAMSRDLTVFHGYELVLPMYDIESIGAGGGSIAWIDSAGRLDVGPRSAGADPGPVCYDRGGVEPTVTDADVVLGVISSDSFLHGRFDINPDLAFRAIERLGARIGLDVYATAAGMNRLIDAKMAELLRRMVQFRGFDPRRFAMLAFGGGGPVHAAASAAAAGIPTVIVPDPHLAPVWSAVGAANADVVHILLEPRVLLLPVDPEILESTFSDLEERARSRFSAETLGNVRLERSLRMKHAMQVFDVDVPIAFEFGDPADIAMLDDEFTRIYEERFGAGSGNRSGGIEITAFALRATLPTAKSRFLFERSKRSERPERSQRPVYWHELGGFTQTPVIRVIPGTAPVDSEPEDGPLLVELPDTVVVARPGQRLWFDAHGNVVVSTLPNRPRA
ncbi:MAG: hydantoinase/oxoprolinase family protein [Gammaproteobacteria bacterium]